MCHASSTDNAREHMCACALVLTVCGDGTQCSGAHLDGELLGSGQVQGHVQGADGCPFAHHGYLLAPQMFWPCVLKLRISDLVICLFGSFCVFGDE